MPIPCPVRPSDGSVLTDAQVYGHLSQESQDKYDRIKVPLPFSHGYSHFLLLALPNGGREAWAVGVEPQSGGYPVRQRVGKSVEEGWDTFIKGRKTAERSDRHSAILWANAAVFRGSLDTIVCVTSPCSDSPLSFS